MVGISVKKNNTTKARQSTDPSINAQIPRRSTDAQTNATRKQGATPKPGNENAQRKESDIKAREGEVEEEGEREGERAKG
jgi:hypothetical protein